MSRAELQCLGFDKLVISTPLCDSVRQDSDFSRVDEIIVVDGGSTDATAAFAMKHGAKVRFVATQSLPFLADNRLGRPDKG